MRRELLGALRGHLRPPPYPFGLKALSVLGKLGGRNRRHHQARPHSVTARSACYVQQALSVLGQLGGRNQRQRQTLPGRMP